MPVAERTRDANCQKHGAFESRYIIDDPKYERHDFAWSGCPECERERDEWRRKRIEEDERRQKAAALRERLNNAQIPPRFANKTFDDFISETGEQRRVLQAVRSYYEQFREHRAVGRCLVMCGSVGTGKTHLAIALLLNLANSGSHVHYTTAAGLIRRLRASWNDSHESSEARVLRELASFDLLVIDEIGVGFGSDSEIAQFSEVVDTRYRECRPTIVISNCDWNGIKRYIGERAADRLRENGGILLAVKGQSWRGRTIQNFTDETRVIQ